MGRNNRGCLDKYNSVTQYELFREIPNYINNVVNQNKINDSIHFITTQSATNYFSQLNFDEGWNAPALDKCSLG